ncbi:MAG TPA: glycerophosphodiester phosphodiesterase family protein [Pseudomonadales bacterium]
MHGTSPFDTPPVIIGHRGAAGLVPENTLPSFARAAALGVQAVELDVHRCEGELVVIHDDTLERTTNGLGPVSGKTLAELRDLDAGGGATVPLLAEVFDLLPPEIGINIELKGADTAELLARWLPRQPGHAILLSSFEHGLLRDFGRQRSDYPLAPLFGRWRPDATDIARAFGSGYINLSRGLVDASRMSAIAGAGLRALVYTVNDLAEARRLVGMGVWGVFTDYPDRISRDTLPA